jgi:acid phosphatase
MVQMAAGNQDLSSWNGFQWRRKMEAFGDNDEAIVATGPGDEIEAMWFVTSRP